MLIKSLDRDHRKVHMECKCKASVLRQARFKDIFHDYVQVEGRGTIENMDDPSRNDGCHHILVIESIEVLRRYDVRGISYPSQAERTCKQ